MRQRGLEESSHDPPFIIREDSPQSIVRERSRSPRRRQYRSIEPKTPIPSASSQESVEGTDDTVGPPRAVSSGARKYQAYVKSAEDSEEDVIATETLQRSQSAPAQEKAYATEQLDRSLEANVAEVFNASREQLQDSGTFALSDHEKEISSVDASANPLDDLKTTLPLQSVNEAANNSLNGLQSTLPLQSRPADVKLHKISDWKSPPAPKPPYRPSLGDQSEKPDAWARYVQNFGDYIASFQAWDALILQHFTECRLLVKRQCFIGELHIRTTALGSDRRSVLMLASMLTSLASTWFNDRNRTSIRKHIDFDGYLKGVRADKNHHESWTQAWKEHLSEM